MAIDWSNTVAQSYYVLSRQGFSTQLVGVMSQVSLSVQYQPGQGYRDEIDASFMGSARTLAGNGGPDAVVIPNGDQTNVQVAGGAWTYSTPSDPHFEESDSFNHTPYRTVIFGRTRLQWWSGAGGTGNLIGEGWDDQILQLSSNPFERVF